MHALIEDYGAAELSARERAICAYALKLTTTPRSMEANDVAALRAAGLKDDAILDVCQVTSYFNYVNRLADGLGVELEERWERLQAP